MKLVIVVDSISFQMPIAQLPISGLRQAIELGAGTVVAGGGERVASRHVAQLVVFARAARRAVDDGEAEGGIGEDVLAEGEAAGLGALHQVQDVEAFARDVRHDEEGGGGVQAGLEHRLRLRLPTPAPTAHPQIHKRN